MEEYKNLVASEMAVLENRLKEYNNYMGERDHLIEENKRLFNNLENEKEDKVRELADKEREKVQETDRLKDEMLMKIRDMRTNLLSLKKEQLSTTTRLAVLQNHQLTGELEFQSKQTEKLIFENESLQKKVTNLQKDISIHKSIEEELAKRTHISKGIIKKLTTRISELEEETNKYKESEKGMNSSQMKKSITSVEMDKKEETICLLDRTIEEKDRKLIKLQSDFELISNENKLLKSRMKDFEKKSLELSTMLIKYYEEILGGKIEVKVNESEKDEFLLDIKGLKKKPVKDWESQECKLIVTLLLNQLKPHISKFNLGVPILSKSQVIVTNEDETSHKLPSKYLPIIDINTSEHPLLKLDNRKFKELPASLIPKLVGSNLREWGRTVHSQSVSNLNRKFK